MQNKFKDAVKVIWEGNKDGIITIEGQVQQAYAFPDEIQYQYEILQDQAEVILQTCRNVIESLVEEERLRIEIIEKYTIGVSVETQTDDRDSKLIEENHELTKKLLIFTTKELEAKQRTENPAVKGRLAEDDVFESLKSNVPQGCTVVMTRSLPRHTDFMLTYSKSGCTLGYALIDVKNYQGSVGSSQVDKLEKDIAFCTDKFHSPPVWAAIISLESNIAHNGVSRATDYLYGSVKVHLVHNLNSSGNVNDGIRSLMTTGYLHVESAHLPSIHRQLSDEVVSKRNLALAETVQLCTQRQSETSSSQVAPQSRVRAMSASAPRQRRVTIAPQF